MRKKQNLLETIWATITGVKALGPWFRPIGAAGPLRYTAVFVLFFAASALRPTSLELYAAAAGVLAALALRVNPMDLLVLGIPFHFALTEPFRATVSIAHFVLPLAVIHVGLQKSRGSNTFEFQYSERLILFWLMLIATTGFLNPVFGNTPLASVAVGIAKLAASASFAILLLGTLRKAVRPGVTLRAILRVWVFTSVPIGVIGLLGNIGAWAIDASGAFSYGGSRLVGTFENPNHFGLYMMVSCFFALIIGDERKKIRFLLVAFMLSSISMMSDSTAIHIAWLCTGLALILLAIFQKSSRQLTSLAALSVMAAGIASFWYSWFAHRIISSSRLSGEGLTAAAVVNESLETAAAVVNESLETAATKIVGDIRFVLWSEAIDFWQREPIIGIGYGNFHLVSTYGLVPHNSFVRLIAETGIVGVIGTIAAIILVVVRGRKAPIPLQSVLLALGATLVFSMGNDVLHSIPFWILIGLTAALRPLSMLGESSPRDSSNSDN